MCGIVGYIGPRNSADVVIQGLRDLNYRGYEAAGIAILNNGAFVVEKYVQDGNGVGRVDPDELLRKFQAQQRYDGSLAIGHTRWPTHGENTVENAHPHLGAERRISVVHNGIIDNFDSLREELVAQGVMLLSETDTEVVAHMIERALSDHDLIDAVKHVVSRLEGSYAFLIADREQPDMVVAAVLGSPLLVGLREGEVFIASDEIVFARYKPIQAVDVEDGDVLIIRRSGIEDSQHVTRPVLMDAVEIDTHGFDHHMMKEIMEQPHTIRAAMSFGGRLDLRSGISRFGGFRHHEDRLAAVEHVVLVACGTAYHAALVGARYLREIAGVPYVEVMIASEADLAHVRPHNAMLIAVSQSGETYDTKKVVEEAKLKGIFAIGIVNRPGSWISRMTICGIHNQAGAEISVASTKVFTSQLSVLYMLAVFMGRQRRVREHEGRDLLQHLIDLPDVLENMLDDEMIESTKWAADGVLADAEFIAFLGRGLFHPIALEGALKLKEISYIPTEGFPAGELKHGSLALMGKKRPAVVLIPDNHHVDAIITSMMEVLRTGSSVVAIVDESLKDRVDALLKDGNHSVISVPVVYESLKPVVFAIVTQLLAYFTALKLDCPIDRPRNLAKSVTVA